MWHHARVPDFEARLETTETDDWLSTPVAVGLAAVSAAATLLGMALPSKSNGTQVAALVLTLIYAIYLGFVFTRGGIVELATGVRGVPIWYVPACAAYDWIVGVGTLAILR